MTAADRFWAKVQKSDGCWSWTGCLTQWGYGQFNVDGKRRIHAHRFAYELTHGELPKHLHACHRCDNRQCVRPDHLFAGTRSDNMRDAVAKGRHRNPLAESCSAKTHCANGHEFNATNTYVNKKGHRNCRVCNRIRMRRTDGALLSAEARLTGQAS